MDNPYKRKKEPERVKQRILQVATQLLATKGLAGFSLQAVADLAGVTKGGVLHHFPNKQVLLQATVSEVIQQLDHEIEQYIKSDPEQYGCFTRAFIHFTLQTDVEGSGGLCTAVSMAMLNDRTFNQQWVQWLNTRLAQHATTDSCIELQILRAAADGLWLTIYTDVADQSQIEQLKQEMMSRTYPKSPI